jgi:hypothetical protein
MKRAGIICDLEYTRNQLYKNYYYAIQYLFGEVRLVQTLSDLNGIEILFVSDDHCYKHRTIFQQPGFVEICNKFEIKVVVFTTEKIFGTDFGNEKLYEYLSGFNDLIHYTCDTDDCFVLGTKANRLCMSRHYKDYVKSEKVDKAIFIGSAVEYYYQERNILLDEVSKIIPIDIIINPISEVGSNVSPITWDSYIKAIAQYRFVLSPLGIGNFPTLRFYETLLVHSIPIQQVKQNIFDIYDIESQWDDCIFFENIEEIPDKIKSCIFTQSNREFWLEDYIEKLLTEDGLYGY